MYMSSAVCEIFGSLSGVVECASLLGCDAAVARTPCHIPADLHLQLCLVLV